MDTFLHLKKPCADTRQMLMNNGFWFKSGATCISSIQYEWSESSFPQSSGSESSGLPQQGSVKQIHFATM